MRPLHEIAARDPHPFFDVWEDGLRRMREDPAFFARNYMGNWDYVGTPEFTLDLMRDLTRAADRLRWANVGERAVLHITRREWDALRMNLSPHQLGQTFGGEGGLPRLNGVRLVIV
jgi:hypothetical protein